jgi:hypothetical protein
MNNTLIFLCIASTLLIFSIIVVNTSPAINGIAGGWRALNCKRYSDFHKYIEEKGTAPTKDEYLKLSKEGRNLCNRKAAMHDLEYASIVCDIVLGFFCAFLSLLHYFGVGKVFEKVTGIIGLASGVICFILTLVYVIYSGYIFTNDNEGMNIEISGLSISKEYGVTPKLDKDGVFAKLDSSKTKYECTYYDANDKSKFYAKYNELGQKRYNYNKDSVDPNSKFSKCRYQYTPSGATEPTYKPSYSRCTNGITPVVPDCDVLYAHHDDYDNKYYYDKWVTSIIFDSLNIALSIGLAIFGFLLFKGSNSDGHTPV